MDVTRDDVGPVLGPEVTEGLRGWDRGDVAGLNNSLVEIKRV